VTMPADVGFLTLLEEAMLGEIDPLGHSRKRCPTTARRSRSVIERIMAHFTTRRIIHTDSRRPPAQHVRHNDLSRRWPLFYLLV